MRSHHTAARRRLLLLSLALALAAGTSCSAGETAFGVPVGSPTDGGSTPPDTSGVVPPDTTRAVPPDTSGSVPPDTSGAVPPDTSGAVPPDSSALLVCGPQAYASATKVIGRAGGYILVGDHGLYIYKNALSEDVAITVEQVEGQVISVRFSPAGLHFAVPAVLWLSYKSCPKARHSKYIVYTDESLNVLESLQSVDFNSSSHIAAPINHFSRYAVAY